MTPSNSSSPPVERIRFGGVQAAIWRHSYPGGGASFSVSLSKSWRDSRGQWRSGTSFHRDDMLVLAQVAEQAFTRLHELQAEERAAIAARKAQQGREGR